MMRRVRGEVMKFELYVYPTPNISRANLLEKQIRFFLERKCNHNYDANSHPQASRLKGLLH